MKAFLASLFGLALIFGASSVNAQSYKRIGFPPTYRAGIRLLVSSGGGLTGDCAKTPPSGLTMTACYDFANGSYTSDGTTAQSSFTAAGGTLPAGCTITAGSGLTCTGTSVATAAPSYSAVNTIVADNINYASGGATVYGYLLGPSVGRALASYFASGARNSAVGGSNASFTGSLNAVSAECAATSTSGYVAAAGAQSQAITNTQSVATGANLYLANYIDGSLPLGATPGAYVKSVRLFTGTCNATNVQAASAN